jgi:hypothetical protein
VTTASTPELHYGKDEKKSEDVEIRFRCNLYRTPV